VFLQPEPSPSRTEASARLGLSVGNRVGHIFRIRRRVGQRNRRTCRPVRQEGTFTFVTSYLMLNISPGRGSRCNLVQRSKGEDPGRLANHFPLFFLNRFGLLVDIGLGHRRHGARLFRRGSKNETGQVAEHF